MAQIRLTIRRYGPGFTYFRAGDEPREVAVIPAYRLYVKLIVVSREDDGSARPDDPHETWSPDAVIDTGAPLSLFPYDVWEPFSSEIWWLNTPHRIDGSRHRVTILGGSWAYRLGRVKLGATDLSQRWLPAVWTTALFLDYYEQGPRVPILGLRSRLLERRVLRSAGDIDDDAIPDWWLEDA